jgi:hypothetical protein
MVNRLIHYGVHGSQDRRLRINPDQIWIYRNDEHTISKRNEALGVTLRAEPELDCVPLCIQWLRMIAEAWHRDPKEWLECNMSRPGHNTQHGSLPVPLESTTAALAKVGPAEMQAAGSDHIRL